MRGLSLLLVFSLLFYTSVPFCAEGDPPAGDAPPDAAAGEGGSKAMVKGITTGIKSDFRTIIFAGIGGAVLGLSTLSFVDKPSEELRRVSYGFAIGAILASFGMLYKVTSKSMVGGGLVPRAQQYDSVDSYDEEEYYDEEEEEDEEEYDDDFYGSINSLYFASVGKSGLRFSVPIFMVDVKRDKGFEINANLFRMTF
jgi:hypothetical protein